MSLVLLMLSFCPVIAGENVDPFSQPINSNEPTAPQGMPTLPHTVDLPSARGGSSGRAYAGSAGDQNRALRERSAEKIRRSEEERAQRRARSQEMRQQADESRERARQSDFVSTSGSSKPQQAAGDSGKIDTGKIEEFQPEITQKRGQDLNVPDNAEEKTQSRRSGNSRLQQTVNRVGNRVSSRANSLGNRAASRANNLGNRAVNRALTPLRRAVNTPIRF